MFSPGNQPPKTKKMTQTLGGSFSSLLQLLILHAHLVGPHNKMLPGLLIVAGIVFYQQHAHLHGTKRR